MVKKREVMKSSLTVSGEAICYRQKSTCLRTAEVEIAVTVTGVVAPRETIAVLGIVLGMVFIVVETVEDALG